MLRCLPRSIAFWDDRGDYMEEKKIASIVPIARIDDHMETRV